MVFGISLDFLRPKKEVSITSVNITYGRGMHTMNGFKTDRKFTYKLPFSNNDAILLRVLSIDVQKPFRLLKISQNLPIEMRAGARIDFEMRCEFEGDYAYSGPLNIKVNAFPVPNAGVHE